MYRPYKYRYLRINKYVLTIGSVLSLPVGVIKNKYLMDLKCEWAEELLLPTTNSKILLYSAEG